MKKLIFIFLAGVIGVAAYALDGAKPDTHGAVWEKTHGKSANIDSSECYSCHTDRQECITCHQDTKPRSHTFTWVNKGHGMESRWERSNCYACHREDSCVACHDSTEPASHRGDYRNNHCQSCQAPVNTWRNTSSKDCITCHRRKPVKNPPSGH